MTENPAVTLSGFELIERIGRGGMGEVWRAERIGPGGVRRRAAVKRILSKFQADPTLRERFVAEARTNSRLEHPNIVQVLDFGDTPELHLVLEYIDGAPVSALMQGANVTHSEIPLPAVCFLVAEAATGLDYAHRRTDEAGVPLGIVHRDVSPQNIMVSIDGAVKVNDFGIARASDNVIRTFAGVALGKQPYMAPEQILGENIDRRADVFALGIVLWELIVLRPLLPRNAPDKIIEALAHCDFQAPSRFRQGVPQELDDIVSRALSRSPEARTQSAARLAQSLRQLLSKLSPGYDSGEFSKLIPRLVPEVARRVSGVHHTAEMPARKPPTPVAAQRPEVQAFHPPGAHARGPSPPPGPSPGQVTPATPSPSPSPFMAGPTVPEVLASKGIPPTMVWAGPPLGPSSLVPPPPVASPLMARYSPPGPSPGPFPGPSPGASRGPSALGSCSVVLGLIGAVVLLAFGVFVTAIYLLLR